MLLQPWKVIREIERKSHLTKAHPVHALSPFDEVCTVKSCFHRSEQYFEVPRYLLVLQVLLDVRKMRQTGNATLMTWQR